MDLRKIVLISFLGLAACQSRSIHEENRTQEVGQEQSAANKSEDSQTGPETSVVKMPVAQEPIRLGIILGPGGSKTFAQIGFLKELQIRKIPVNSIFGLEWGSLVGASYAANASAHDAEWQLSKLKDGGTNWLGNSTSKIKDVLGPLKAFLESYRAESLKVPFACSSLNLKKSQVYVMARGRMDQLLPYCLPYPPYFAAYERNIAGPREIQQAVDFLKQKGANYIILVNVLAGMSQDEPINWLELAYDMKRKWPGVNERLDIVISGKSISDFKSRQELIQLGTEQSAKFADKLLSRF
jgi:NTE family protein